MKNTKIALMTLLLSGFALASCGGTPVASSEPAPAASSEPAPATSSEAPAASSEAAPESSEAPAASSEAASESSEAPAASSEAAPESSEEEKDVWNSLFSVAGFVEKGNFTYTASYKVTYGGRDMTVVNTIQYDEGKMATTMLGESTNYYKVDGINKDGNIMASKYNGGDYTPVPDVGAYAFFFEFGYIELPKENFMFDEADGYYHQISTIAVEPAGEGSYISGATVSIRDSGTAAAFTFTSHGYDMAMAIAFTRVGITSVTLPEAGK